MRVAGIVITALVVLAAAQAAAVVIGLLVMLAIFYGMFVHPRETIGLLGFCLLAGLIERFPEQCLGLMALLVVASLFRAK